MTMTLASLQKALEEYPERLQRALKRQSRAETAVKRIKEEVEQAEAGVETDDQDGPGGAGGSDIEKMRLRYTQKRAQLELKIRQEPLAFGFGTVKPTESTVQAVLDADEELCAMKERLIEAEHKRHEERMSMRLASMHREPKTVDSKLRTKLWEAEEESENADIEVDVLRETLETYRMLTAILTGAESVMTSLDLG